jgi:AcrR family transcriptional regulator
VNKPINRTKYYIVRAAISLFSVKGFGSTSIREISEAAQVNSALISYHFKNKQGILEWIMVDYFESLFNQLRMKEPQDTIEAEDCFQELITAVDTIIGYQSKHIEVSTIIQREMSVDSMLVREVMSTYVAKLKAVFSSLIERGIETNQFRDDIDNDMQVLHIMSSIFFPFFNPQIPREVFYIEPISEGFQGEYMAFLTKSWTHQLKK